MKNDLHVDLPEAADRERLGGYVLDRRAQLGIGQQALAHSAGIGTTLTNRIERGKQERFRRTSLVRIEKALRWEPGSIDAIVAGGEPVPMADAEPEPVAERLAERLADLERAVSELSDLLRLAGQTGTRGLTPVEPTRHPAAGFEWRNAVEARRSKTEG